MNNRKTKRFLAAWPVIVVLVLLSAFLTGCQSTDKSQAFMSTDGFENATFEYNAVNNQTRIVFNLTLTNDTIYNFEGFSLTVKLYNQSGALRTETFNGTRAVKHGGRYSNAFELVADGRVTGIEFVSWSAKYRSLWDTYKIWFIVMISVAGAAAVAYTVMMIVEDWELDDTFGEVAEFFEFHGWAAIGFIVPIAGIIWGIVSSHWVPVLIVTGGILAFVAEALVAHLVKFIVEKILDSVVLRNSGYIERTFAHDVGDSFDSAGEYVGDYVNDKDALMSFTVGQLKEYCRDNEIQGYSSLNKAGLTELIYDSENEEPFDPSAEYVGDYVDDVDTLMLFTAEQLKEYCRDNEIQGYSSLNKAALAELIYDSEMPRPRKARTKKAKDIDKGDGEKFVN